MKAIQFDQLNPLGNSLMTEFTRVKGNRDLGGHADVTAWAKSAFWTPILAQLGISYDDIGTGGGGLVMNGSDEDFQNVQRWVEQGSGGMYTAYRDADSRVTLLKTAHKGHVRLNDKQRAFIDILLDATDENQGLVTIDLVNNSENVFVGSLFGGTIDVGDIEQFGKAIGRFDVVSSVGIFAHEVFEQVLAQRYSGGKVVTLSDNTANEIHKMAITDAENLVNGSTFEGYAKSNNVTITNGPNWRGTNKILIGGEIRNGNMDVNYRLNGVITTISIAIKNNNIISVKPL